MWRTAAPSIDENIIAACLVKVYTLLINLSTLMLNAAWFRLTCRVPCYTENVIVGIFPSPQPSPTGRGSWCGAVGWCWSQSAACSVLSGEGVGAEPWAGAGVSLRHVQCSLARELVRSRRQVQESVCDMFRALWRGSWYGAWVGAGVSLWHILFPLLGERVRVRAA
ncbi:Uncharacterised protein [Serratia fonticola]|nr:Uncharacterised protein [Serratia fonticola]